MMEGADVDVDKKRIFIHGSLLCRVQLNCANLQRIAIRVEYIAGIAEGINVQLASDKL